MLLLHSQWIVGLPTWSTTAILLLIKFWLCVCESCVCLWGCVYEKKCQRNRLLWRRSFAIVHCVPHLFGKPISPTWHNTHIHTQNTYSTHFEDTAGGKIKLIKLTDKSSCAREEGRGGGGGREWGEDVKHLQKRCNATAKTLSRSAGPISSVQQLPFALHGLTWPKCLQTSPVLSDFRLHLMNEQCKV